MCPHLVCPHVRTQWGQPSANQEEVHTWTQLSWQHDDLKFQASRTVRNKFLLLKLPSLWYFHGSSPKTSWLQLCLWYWNKFLVPCRSAFMLVSVSSTPFLQSLFWKSVGQHVFFSKLLFKALSNQALSSSASSFLHSWLASSVTPPTILWILFIQTFAYLFCFLLPKFYP
jgi:hypothetical protein